ncbi:MAG TPA: hypothetical protein VGA61_14310, partial [Anaerolineae bacterium]
YYYLRVTVAMYMETPQAAAEPAAAGVTATGAAAARKARPVAVTAAAPAPSAVLAAATAPAGDGLAGEIKGRVFIGNYPGETLPSALAGGYLGESAPAPHAGSEPLAAWPLWLALALSAAATLVLGLWQAPWMQTIMQAVGTVVR